MALAIMAAVCCLHPVAMLAASTITYVQSAYADPQTPQTTVNIAFTGAQTAGDLNVVVVGWNDSTATVSSVHDSKGNVYTRAVGPTTINGTLSQSIYYAKNIVAAAAGANTVTVTFSAAAVYPDIRILEYEGADPNNPVDVTAAGSGHSTSSSSGSATTTNATDLIFGANTVTTVSGVGTGFTRRILTSPDGDIAEDKMVTTVGSYSATAPISPSGQWIMQMVAFRTGASFTIAASPTSLSIVEGNQGTSTITTAVNGGFNSAIGLTASGAPAGTTVSFNPSTIPAPGSGTSTMTVTVGVSTPVGTYPITVTGNGGGVQQNTTVTLTVTAPPNFTMSALPAALTIAQGNQGTSTITTTVSGGFNSAIALSATGAPSGTTVSFNPSTIPAPGSGTSTMTIMVGASTPTGAYPITVTGNGGGIQSSTSVTLTVTTPANFTVAASPTSLSIAQGNQGNSTITTTISGSFNSAIALSANGTPSGTTVSFNPSTIPAPGSGMSTMTITVGTSTPTGTYPITVTGNGGGIQNNTTVTLTVTATPNFTISASPATLSIAQGNQGTSTITTGVSGGFNNSIALSAAGAPSGTTVSFNPTTIPTPGSGTSTMTIMVGSATPTGTYPITVTGNGGGVQQNTTVTLTVTAITAPTNVSVTDGGPAPIVDAVQSYINSTFLTVHTTAPFNSSGGDLIVMYASSHAGVTMTPSDNFNNTWVTIAGPTNTSTGFDLRSQIWYVANPTVGPNQTVTLTLSAPESLVMSIFVVKGSNTSSPIDAVSLIGSDNGTQTVNVVSPNITTAMVNDLLMGWVKVSAGATFMSGPGFIQQPGASSNFLDAESGTAATPGAYDATFTLNAAQTWQSAIVAANNHSNQTTLTWTPSTENGGTITEYLMERCQGTGCNNFVQIGTTTTTSYNDDGLTASTSYNYRLRAEDSNGNLGPYSSVVSITTPSIIPSLPGNLTSTTPSQTEIDLSWVASTETNGVIAEYLVERCPGASCTNFTQIGTTTGTTYDDTGLTAGTYNYRARAQDSAGGLGPYSNVAIGTTQSAGSFTLTASPAALDVAQGNQGVSTITTTASGGFNSSITLSASGAPAGTTVGFNPSTISAPGSGTSTMTITVGSSTPVGSYPITVTGNGGGIQQNATVTLTVTSTSTIISYVQGNSATPQTPQTTVNVPFTAAQVAGDLNVVVVGWNDSTASVSSVIDSKGNAYTLAVGPTSISGTLSQSVYYAKNIVSAGAGTNTVTVTFSPAAIYPDIRVLEYSGADQNSPVDVIAANTGDSAISSSGSATTTNPIDLLFGANTVTTITSGPGSGFTSRIITSPDGDIAEDQVVTTTGSYSATAPLSSGAWIMQMVAFKANSGGGPVLTSIGVTPVNPLIAVGSPQQFTATGTYSDGSHQDLTNSATWTSSIPSVATISSTGLATGAAPGSTTIQAALGAINGSTSLTVTAGFSVRPRAAVVTFTQTQQFTATSGFGTVTWSVDGVVGGSPATGTITTNGLYTPPTSAGSHTVTATTNQQQSANATVYVSNYAGTFTYHNDNLRTGQNNNETVLTPANVNQGQFGKLFSFPIDGIAFASPLYVPSVNIPGQGYHNVVYVATEHDSIYAFDADGLANAPLWQISFLSSNVTTIPCGDTGECGDIPVEVGITGTPVIDPSTGTMYVVVNTEENGTNYFQRLHAVDITTGAEKFGGPVVLSGSVAGTGDGSSGGNVAFDPLHECQRPGLLLNNGVVYIGFGSHGDNHPWHGWVLGYNAATLQQVMIYNATPNAYGGGIWQGGGGLATDATGDIYFTTSNGPFDVNTGGVDYGDSVEKLAPSGSVVDYFTPHDQQNLSSNNLDLGAAGPVLLVDQPTSPYPHELITAGKGGTIYVINRDNLGHYNGNNDNQIIQVLIGALPYGNQEIGNFSTPVYFNGYVYFAAVNDYLKAFQLTNGLLSTSPTSQSPEIYPIRGGSFAASANGGANGIIWAIQNNGASPDNDTGAPGVLFAYNATNLSNELYNSSQAGSRDAFDLAAKFMIPVVANGKVFVAGQTQFIAYGLLP
ncbi:MAG: Ig-like domain-containing protein [Candidatus Korobacteraceae bacterium]